MRCPSIIELPPTADRQDWPWTQGSKRSPDKTDNSDLWPKISIVTPNLNQGEYIEETIRSILLQGYPNIEYIMMDGGSTDESLDIIKKYKKWIHIWESKPDKGQSHAINKGFRLASGDIYAYINSNDLYAIDAFYNVAALYREQKEPDLIVGKCLCFSKDGNTETFKPTWPENTSHFLRPFSSTFAQPAAFWTRRIYELVGEFDENLHFCFDQEFYLRLKLHNVNPIISSKIFANYRVHDDSKTLKHRISFYQETKLLNLKHSTNMGLSKKNKNKIMNSIDGEIQYINVIQAWRERGRFRGLISFLYLIMRYPNKISERHILGLFRRLLSYRYENIPEFKKY